MVDTPNFVPADQAERKDAETAVLFAGRSDDELRAEQASLWSAPCEDFAEAMLNKDQIDRIAHELGRRAGRSS